MSKKAFFGVFVLLYCICQVYNNATIYDAKSAFSTLRVFKSKMVLF
jgi:hypothetical protein